MFPQPWFLAGDLRRAVLASVLALLPACRSNDLPPSEWPPRDFRIEVRGVDAGGDRFQSFQVWANGVAVYREADRTLPGVPDALPIFDTVCVYRLDPRTTRTLARELGRAGLLQRGAPIDDNRELVGEDISISWWAFGVSGFASRRLQDRGPLDRALRVVDAYLPDSRSFADGEPEDRHVADVPEPIRFVPGALVAHEDVVRECDVDAAFLREVFALAVAAGDAGVARGALDEIERLGPGGGSGELVESGVWEAQEMAPLRAILRRLQDG